MFYYDILQSFKNSAVKKYIAEQLQKFDETYDSHTLEQINQHCCYYTKYKHFNRMTAQEALEKIRGNDNNLPYVSEVENEIHEKIFNSLNSNKNQLVIGQCGLGKTKHIIDWLALQQDKKILVCLPRYNMIDQYADALDKLNIPYERAIKKNIHKRV